MPPERRGAKKPSHDNDSLLDAAEDVVLEEGIGRFTLDSVAARAKVSKGGLIHHFPSKEILIRAMVRRIMQEWRSDVLEAVSAQPPGPGRVPRACVELAFRHRDRFADRCRRSGQVLMAATVQGATLVEPLREFQRELLGMIEQDGLPPGVGEAVVLATDGLWLQSLFSLDTFSGARAAKVRSALDALINTPASVAPPSARAARHTQTPAPRRRVIRKAGKR
ncbi:MAG: TetR/AcrR family transcriptional regulator [Planctomycetes bacterium]|nr:TetR/AcrR family transcriptional regulator [Planctomycetota bacterium]